MATTPKVLCVSIGFGLLFLLAIDLLSCVLELPLVGKVLIILWILSV